MFAAEFGIHHVTSSPGHPSGNGETERAVRTIKDILRSSNNPYISILNYHSTPLANGLSPAQLLMNRQLRTKLPVISEKLRPQLIDEPALQAKETHATED